MPGLLIGPYARQVTGTKLKFWFALKVAVDGRIMRYEIAIDTFTRKPDARQRPIYPGKVPTHSSNFNEYLPPSDLSPYPCVEWPRFPRDKMSDAALTLLRGQDIADFTRVRMIGVLPEPAKHGKPGDTPCTSNQPPLI